MPFFSLHLRTLSDEISEFPHSKNGKGGKGYS